MDEVGFFERFLQFLASTILLFIVGVISLHIIRLMYEVFHAKSLVYIRVMLPRADSKLDKERETRKDFKEKISSMTVFYNSIHKLGNIQFWDTLRNWVLKRTKMSLELVYDKGEVYFFVVVYDTDAKVISQQITALYPDAEVAILRAKEYPEIKPQGYTLRASSIFKSRDNIYPIKPYKIFEDDPLSSLTNSFGSLKKEDVAVMQLTLKPAGRSWNKRAKKAAGLVAKGEYKSMYSGNFLFHILAKALAPLSWFVDFFVTNNGADTNAPGASSGDAYKIFNQAETEAQKRIGESASQLAFCASIRFLVASDTPESAETGLQSLIAVTSSFSDEYNNSLDNHQFEDLFKFIFVPIRYFSFQCRLLSLIQTTSIYSTDELSTLFHFPDIKYNLSPIIKWLAYKMIAPPPNLKVPKEPLIMSDFKRDSNGNIYTEDGSILRVDKNKNLLRNPDRSMTLITGESVAVYTEGENIGRPIDAGKNPVAIESHRMLGGFPLYKDAALMGWNEYRNQKTPIYFSKKDRGRHHYIIGKSGGGKSVFVGYMARQDLWSGDGLAVIDPHGDLIEDIIAFTPKSRAKDMIIFDPGDWERPMGMNILEVISTDPTLRAMEKDRAALDATAIFIKIFGDEIFGPRIQHYFRNGALTLMEDDEEGGTLIDVPRLFVDDAFMKYKVSKVKNPVVKAFWEHEYASTGDREKQEMIPYFSAKFGPFITNTIIRNIIGQPKSAFNFRRVMDDQKALMVNLSKGTIGDLNAQLLGLIMVSKINMAAMSRANIPESERKDFFLYVDEFQNFATDTFGEILSEARKYRLALIMAHQFIAQIGGSGDKHGKGGKPSIKDAVFGNAGTIMSFKVGADDAEYLEKEYAPVLSQQDIIGIANFTTYCKLNIDNASSRPFDLKTLWDNTYKNEEAAKIIKEYSRKTYGRKKEYVDMEIEARL